MRAALPARHAGAGAWGPALTCQHALAAQHSTTAQHRKNSTQSTHRHGRLGYRLQIALCSNALLVPALSKLHACSGGHAATKCALRACLPPGTCVMCAGGAPRAGRHGRRARRQRRARARAHGARHAHTWQRGGAAGAGAAPRLRAGAHGEISACRPRTGVAGLGCASACAATTITTLRYVHDEGCGAHACMHACVLPQGAWLGMDARPACKCQNACPPCRLPCGKRRIRTAKSSPVTSSPAWWVQHAYMLNMCPRLQRASA